MLFSIPYNGQNLSQVLRPYQELIHDVYVTEFNRLSRASQNRFLSLNKEGYQLNMWVSTLGDTMACKELARGSIGIVTGPTEVTKTLKDEYHVHTVSLPRVIPRDYISAALTFNPLVDIIPDFYTVDTSFVHQHDAYLQVKGNPLYGVMPKFYGVFNRHHSRIIEPKQAWLGLPVLAYDATDLAECTIHLAQSEFSYYSDIIDVFQFEPNSSIEEITKVLSVVIGKANYLPKLSDLELWLNEVHNCKGRCTQCNLCKRFK